MKRKMGVIIIGLVIVIIIGIIVTMNILENKEKEESKYSAKLTKLINKKRTYNGDLVELVYSNSGDMCGNVYTVQLDVENKKIIKSEKTCHNDPLQIKEYSVTDKDIKIINDYIEEYNFPMWKNLKQTEYVLDASTREITFSFDIKNSEWLSKYTVYYLADMPSDGRSALEEFTSFYLGLMKEDFLIREYTNEE